MNGALINQTTFEHKVLCPMSHEDGIQKRIGYATNYARPYCIHCTISIHLTALKLAFLNLWVFNAVVIHRVDVHHQAIPITAGLVGQLLLLNSDDNVTTTDTIKSIISDDAHFFEISDCQSTQYRAFTIDCDNSDGILQ